MDQELRKQLDDAFQRGKDFGEEIANGFRETEGDIDSWLVRWAKSDYSLGIAICFGLTLLGLGAMLGSLV